MKTYFDLESRVETLFWQANKDMQTGLSTGAVAVSARPRRISFHFFWRSLIVKATTTFRKTCKKPRSCPFAKRPGRLFSTLEERLIPKLSRLQKVVSHWYMEIQVKQMLTMKGKRRTLKLWRSCRISRTTTLLLLRRGLSAMLPGILLSEMTMNLRIYLPPTFSRHQRYLKLIWYDSGGSLCGKIEASVSLCWLVIGVLENVFILPKKRPRNMAAKL